MESDLQNRCDQLLENYDRMTIGNKFEYNSLIAAGAAMYAAAGTQVDTERLLECRKLLKTRKGIFSNYRGTAEFIVRCKLAMSNDPESYFERLDSVYGELKNAFSSEQTLLAAIVITDFAERGKESDAVEKTRTIYKEMSKAHPWLTSQDDMPFAALMAVVKKDAVSVYEEAESNYAILKEKLNATPGTRQMLSHVLALYPGHSEIKCDRICRLAAGLKAAKHPLSGDRYVAILGTLAASPLKEDDLIRMIADADDYIKQHKGFHGLFGIDRNVRRMLAVQMVEAAQEESDETGTMSGAAAVSTMISSSIEVAIITLLLMYTVIATTSAASHHS